MRGRRVPGGGVPGDVDAALHDLARRLAATGVVEALWVGGSLATGDYVSEVSDLDLVAVTSGPLEGDTQAEVVRIHTALDEGGARGMDLGCQYLDRRRLAEVDTHHPTWTHGQLVDRAVTLVTRAELVRHGYAVLGRPPQDVLPPVGPEEVRAAARAELAGYWSDAARRPLMFVRMPVMVDLGLTAMARGRHAIATGELLAKSSAIDDARAPAWLRNHLHARRHGHDVTSPRWRAAVVAWQDVRRTTASSRERRLSETRGPTRS